VWPIQQWNAHAGAALRLEMRSEHDIHPEFGWLAPGPRLRRELRIAFFSALIGLAIGAMTESSVRVEYGPGNAASPAGTKATVAASPVPQSPPSAEPDRTASGGAAASSRTSAGASTHVDRPQWSTALYPIDRPLPRRVEPPQGAPTSAPVPDAQRSPPPPSAGKARTLPPQPGPALQAQRSANKSRFASDGTSGAVGNASRGTARDTSSRRFGFWDWSQ
jgi:hypothetical protein